MRPSGLEKYANEVLSTCCPREQMECQEYADLHNYCTIPKNWPNLQN